MKNKKSEYIRRDYNEVQEVATNLNFTGDLSIKDGVEPNHPVTLRQVTEASNNIKNELVAALPATIKPLEKLSFCIYGENYRTPTTGGVVTSINHYPGVGGICFTQENGAIMIPVAYSWGEGFNAVTTYSYVAEIMGVKQLYYIVADSTTANKIPLKDRRRVEYPLTQEDKDYLGGFNSPIVCVNMENQNNYHFTSSQNYYDWSSCFCAFKTFAQGNIGYSSQASSGLLTANSSVSTNYLRFWIENDTDYNSLDNFINSVVGFTFGSPFTNSSNYGCPCYRIQMFKNNYLEIDELVEWYKHYTSRCYHFVNISENEAYNNFEFASEFLASYGSTANINYLQLGFKSRIKYNATTKKYEVVYI